MKVVFSKAESGEDYVEIARGTWDSGRDPVLTGEPIPPQVLRGMEVQVKGTRGTVTYDLSDQRYAMDFEE